MTIRVGTPPHTCPLDSETYLSTYTYFTTIVVYLCHLDRAGGDRVRFSADAVSTGRDRSSSSGHETRVARDTKAGNTEENGPTQPVS